jgi:hypothetical protein
MAFRFDDAIVTRILAHMNDDHRDDNLLIVRAFGPGAEYRAATMTGFDGDAGRWSAERADGRVDEVEVAWPDGPIDERPHVRREIVALYDEACAKLGIQPRPHS